MLAKQQGWDPEKDVKVVGLGGLDAQLAALTRGEIHAFVWGDGGAVTELQGKSKILLRLDTVTPKWISQVPTRPTTPSRATRTRSAGRLKALFQGAQVHPREPREAAAIARKTLQWPEEAIARAQQISGPSSPRTGRSASRPSR